MAAKYHVEVAHNSPLFTIYLTVLWVFCVQRNVASCQRTRSSFFVKECERVLLVYFALHFFFLFEESTKNSIAIRQCMR